MRKLLVLFSLLFVCLNTQAKTLIISDIDDTLKQSHSVDRGDALENALLTDNPFLGMNGVMIAVKAEHPDIKIYYVSNAIRKMMEGQHARFLAASKFPEGPMLLRHSVLDSQFKRSEITKIFNAEKPTHVIFFGDNGEKDAGIYEQLRKDFPQVKFLTYIHLAYSVKNQDQTGTTLFPGQIGYATSFDLLSSLNLQGVTSVSMLERFYAAYAPKYLQEDPRQKGGAVTIPGWMDCRDFAWNAPTEPAPGSVFEAVKKKVVGRCSSQPLFVNANREHR
jgi:hypothetical protein